MRLSYRSPGFISLVALLLRLVFAANLYSWQPMLALLIWGNGFEMGRVAANLAAGAGFSSPFTLVTGPTALIPPVYPLLVAAVFKLLGTFSLASTWMMIFLQALMSALTCLAVFRLAGRILDERTAALAAWLWALFPPSVLAPGYRVWETCLSALLLCVLLLVSLDLEQSTAAKLWLGFGLLTGVAALVNPALLTVAAVLLLFPVYLRRHRVLPAVRLAALSLLALAAVLLPWTLRNYRALHALVPLRTSFGLEFWMGNHPGTTGYFDPRLHPLNNRDELERYRRLGEVAYMQEKARQGTEFAAAQPLAFLRLSVARFARFWLGISEAGIDSARLLLTLLGIIGLLHLARRQPAVALCWALVLLLYPAPYYLTHADMKFRHVIDPLLGILGAHAALVIADRMKVMRHLRSPQLRSGC